MEDDTANNNRNGGCEVASEAECGGRGSDIFWLNKCLERDEWALEVWADTDAGDDLVDDDAGPAGFRGEIDVKADPQGHEKHAEPDRGKVLACFLDEDTDRGGDEGEGENEGKRVDAGENGRGAEDSLEVERNKIGSGDECGAMAETNGESGNVGAVLEKAKRHDRVEGELPLVKEEEDEG